MCDSLVHLDKRQITSYITYDAHWFLNLFHICFWELFCSSYYTDPLEWILSTFPPITSVTDSNTYSLPSLLPQNWLIHPGTYRAHYIFQCNKLGWRYQILWRSALWLTNSIRPFKHIQMNLHFYWFLYYYNFWVFWQFLDTISLSPQVTIQYISDFHKFNFSAWESGLNYVMSICIFSQVVIHLVGL